MKSLAVAAFSLAILTCNSAQAAITELTLSGVGKVRSANECLVFGRTCESLPYANGGEVFIQLYVYLGDGLALGGPPPVSDDFTGRVDMSIVDRSQYFTVRINGVEEGDSRLLPFVDGHAFLDFVDGELVALDLYHHSDPERIRLTKSTWGVQKFNSIADGGWRVNGTSAAIPEPASWALMIGGFGIAGAALRRRSGGSRHERA